MKATYLLGALALAACHSSPTVTATNASVADVAAKMKAANLDGSFVSPGHWQTTMVVKDMSIPGMPPQMAEKMKAHMGQAKTFESCLTEEEAKKPKEDFFGADRSCRYDKFDMGGGKIDATMTCASDGMTRTMTMNGTYSSDAYHMAMATIGTGKASAMGNMSMKMEMDAKRTGACTGKEDH